MKRDYSTGEIDTTPDFFIGLEVEKTKAHNIKTLFCRGDVLLSYILETLKIDKTIEHVYLNSNHTELIDGIKKINTLLATDLKFVTYEFFVYDEVININHTKLIHLFSIPFANCETVENLFFKIDDIDFNASNSGVWVFNINHLQKLKTTWNEYKNDKII